MTEEQLTKANKLKEQIQDVQAQYDIIQDILMQNTVIIGNNEVGSVRLRVDKVIPALTFIQDVLLQAKESAQEKFDEL